MNENQKKWLLKLQEKGIKFENANMIRDRWFDGIWRFEGNTEQFRIPAQTIPDIPDWRELCREMQSKWVKFENLVLFPDRWEDGSQTLRFYGNREYYRIPQQPIPEWSSEEMPQETKPDPREEIPHRELQIQWHEDMLHHLRTGEPMREYEFRSVNEDGDAASEWKLLSNRHPSWAKTHEYRRKPRTVTYWHCAVMFEGLKTEVITGYCKDEVIDQIKRCKEAYPDAKFSPIIETTVEMED